MKKIIFLVIVLLISISCNKNLETSDKVNLDTISVKNSTTNEIKTIKEFYTLAYGNDKPSTDEKLMKEYVSERVLAKIDSLNDENLILDYDPFIKSQDYSGNIIRKTLEVKPLNNKNEYRVSFLLFGSKNEKKTNVDILLKETSNEKFLIYSILNDEYLNFKNKINDDDKNTNSNNFIVEQWYGNYVGSFLRLEGESSDPRGWATVNLKISRDSMIFNISSYVEEKAFKLALKGANESDVIFNMENNNIVKIKKDDNNTYILKSTYIDNLMKNRNEIK